MITTHGGKIIRAEIKGEHLKNDDCKEKIELGKVGSSHTGSWFRYYMVFQKGNGLSKDAVSMSRFAEIVVAL